MATPCVYEVNNIAPSDLNIEFLGSYNRARIAAAKRVARHVCRDEIPPRYIKKAFNDFKTGFLYTDPETDAIEGLCLWKDYDREGLHEKQKYIFIYLICGRNRELFGNRLFTDLDRYCEDHGYEFMELKPANDRLKEYYTRHGFAAIEPSRPYIFTKIVHSVIERRARGRGATRRSEAREARRTDSRGKQGYKLTFRKNNHGTPIGPDNAVVL
jgi:hypothetical protein